ncbi:YbgA family protein [Methanomethylovorans sp.]|uniref:YbgA family protein n=1 Tax=Methanomethylovorans sp. TaxID=2758717 RepID=UPI003D0C046E
MVISKCLGFERCRYNGKMVTSDIIENFRPFVEFITVCPEGDIGLGTPRDPIRLVNGENLRLIQPSTGQDITEKMQLFVSSFLENLSDVDGFILKSKSPSCGLRTTKVFPTADAQEPLHKHGTGFLAKGLLDRFTNLPYADEVALMDPEIREHFLTRIFMYADLRLHLNSIQELMDFQSRNKLLLMAYDQRRSKVLGRILADHKQRPFAEIVRAYTRTVKEITLVPPSRGNVANAFMHAFGYFSHKMGSDKKQYLLDCMEAYRKGVLTLQELRKSMIPWILGFRIAYLEDQTLFYPYPENSGIADQYKGNVNIQH